MSREIKFKAYVKEIGAIYDVYELYSDGGVMVSGYDFQLGPDDIELMQFTGLKDKNGVDIYEGDIVSEPISPVGGKDGGYLYKSKVIKWNGAGRGYSLFAPHAASTVIGNIYENPELLNP